ncbi:hypothetical protein ACP70R_028658 [Stipagrostis hirtigluma subsp. patula]
MTPHLPILLLPPRLHARLPGSGVRPVKVVVDVSSPAEYGALSSGKQTTNTTTSSSSSGARPLAASDVRGAVESLTAYKYSELEKATVGFSEDRRDPGTSVYRAVISGDNAAVKRVAGDVGGEVGILKRVNPSSLVRLSGLCVHRGDTCLVFEFAENGALSDWLHGGGHGGNSGNVLRWRQRMQVAFDVADELNYLHHYTNPPCVHKNLKSSNVLLTTSAPRCPASGWRARSRLPTAARSSPATSWARRGTSPMRLWPSLGDLLQAHHGPPSSGSGTSSPFRRHRAPLRRMRAVTMEALRDRFGPSSTCPGTMVSCADFMDLRRRKDSILRCVGRKRFKPANLVKPNRLNQ